MKLVVRHRGRERLVRVDRDGSRALVELDEHTNQLDVHPLDASVRSILWDGQHYDVAVRHLGDDHYEVSGDFGSETVQVLEPLAHLATASHDAQTGPQSQRVDAYMPGRVVEILVKEGDRLAIGEGILVLEAMKMENEIQCERAGTIRKIFVAAGQAVESGDALYEIE